MAFEVDLKFLYKETQRREHEIQRQEFRLGEMGADRYMLFFYLSESVSSMGKGTASRYSPSVMDF